MQSTLGQPGNLDKPDTAGRVETTQPTKSQPPMTDTKTNDVILTRDDQRRIRQAMSRMPYAADTRVTIPGRPPAFTLDADRIVGFLEQLAAVLNAAGLHETAMEAELSQYRNDLAAFRR